MTCLFRPLLEETLVQLNAHQFAPREVPEPFSRRSSLTGVELTSFWARHEAGAEMKCAYLLGAKVEILNLMIYPKCAAAVPIFACEYIALMQKPYVAVVDLQPACPQSPLTSEVVAALDSSWPMTRGELTSGGDIPDWARDYFTPVCVYARPRQAGELSPLLTAFRDYLQVWLEDFLPREDGQVSDAAALARYQAHHIAHTPGRPFLSKTFGVEWTESYLHEFMYGSRLVGVEPLAAS